MRHVRAAQRGAGASRCGRCATGAPTVSWPVGGTRPPPLSVDSHPPEPYLDTPNGPGSAHRLEPTPRYAPGTGPLEIVALNGMFVALYQHVGYEVVGRGTIAPGLETWGMYRADRER